MLIEKVKEGNVDVFKMAKVKNREAYAADIGISPYFHYLLWNEAFAPVYGEAPNPTYMALKIPLKINSKKDMEEFLKSIDNEIIRNGILKMMKEYKKDKIGTFLVPLINALEKGIPKELLNYIDIDGLIKDNCNVMYIILSSLGFYLKPEEKVLDYV